MAIITGVKGEHMAMLAPEDGGGGGGSPQADPPAVAFAEQLPENIRGEAAFRDIKDLGSLANSYLNAQKLIGHRPDDLVVVPGPDDTEGWSKVFNRLGRPEAADKYAFKPAEGVTVDEGLQGKFRQAAFDAGLTTKQAEGLFNWWNQEASGMKTAAEQARTAKLDESTAALKTEWGQAFEQNLNLAKKALQHYGGDDLQKELDANGLGNSPQLAKVLAKLGKGLSEDGVIGRGEGGTGLKSPGEAQQEISSLQADPQFLAAYGNKNAPGHADAIKRMSGLFEIAYPNG